MKSNSNSSLSHKVSSGNSHGQGAALRLPGWPIAKYISEANTARAFLGRPSDNGWPLLRLRVIAYVRHTFSNYDRLWPTLSPPEAEALHASLNRMILARLPWLRAGAPDPRTKETKISIVSRLNYYTAHMRETTQVMRASGDRNQRALGHTLAAVLDKIVTGRGAPVGMIFEAPERSATLFFLGLPVFPNMYTFLTQSCARCGARIATLKKRCPCGGTECRVSACYCYCVVSPSSLGEITWPGSDLLTLD